ncbi:MAG TPA: AAA family ATPase [Candidatus Saccharimonadales bacterium]|nr:AAA family ATPase [Candidatus Saccharimonadales bacterium]
MKIIGVGGTNGAGKDSVGVMLAERYGFLFVSVSDFLREEAKKRGLPVEREVLRMISAEWRRESGLGVLVDRSVALFDETPGKYKGVVAIPMRNVGEARRVHELGGKLVWVDADPKVRYGRIKSRARSAEDNKTFQEFLAEEKAESQQSGDEATLDLDGVKAISDIFLENNGNDIEAFKTIAAEKLAVVL